MRFLRTLSRYFLLTLTAAALIVGLNNCAAPSKPTASAPTATTSTALTADAADKININSAILSELDKLEAKLGIPALSNKIQASRPYGSTADLVSKGVITQAQYDQIQNMVTVEDIVLTGEAKDVDYLTKLGLMKGHMMIAEELLVLGQPEKAVPHLGHPVEEIYVDIQDQLGERNVPEFSDVLTRVQDLVKSKPNDPQVQSQFQAGMAAIDQAIAALPEADRQKPEFTLQVINEMLDTAAAEYTASISNGKISAEIEYQDSMGFVTYAKDTLFKGIESPLAQSNPGVDKTLKAKLAELAKAWTAPIPPAKPVMTADEVVAQVKAIEQASKPAIQ
ncbi:helix-hairpin-helix domain-containing protein [Leptolyngbya ohadii]|uniref:helix-hairpin-helix domain-containing protein n=1 Tax=Leptolyngbya ohadii TaxID=1962290 RepID=UPI000B59B3C1|nr:helix-hairpin-helix domain-containing protein [Leptolyngbya ohadii]